MSTELKVQEFRRGDSAIPDPLQPPSAWRAAIYYKEWKGATLLAWKRFLPTANVPSHYYSVGPWTLVKPAPPLTAVKAIEAAQAEGLFSRIEVWTPEGQYQRGFWQSVALDPVAIGVVEGRYFPIVRWGAELLPNWTVRRKAWWMNLCHTVAYHTPIRQQRRYR